MKTAFLIRLPDGGHKIIERVRNSYPFTGTTTLVNGYPSGCGDLFRRLRERAERAGTLEWLR